MALKKSDHLRQADLFGGAPVRKPTPNYAPKYADAMALFDAWDYARMVPNPDYRPPEWLRLPGVDDD